MTSEQSSIPNPSPSNKDCDVTVLTIAEFLSANSYTATQGLAVPVYQRPYRWGAKNITTLLTDIYNQANKHNHTVGATFNPDNAYRLGTVVLHQPQQGQSGVNDKNPDNTGQTKLAVVDGQQRTLTLLLIITAAKQFRDEQSKAKRLGFIQDGFAQLNGFTPVDIKLPNCTETQNNLSANFELIKHHLTRPEFTPAVLDYLLNHCQIVQVTLYDLSEAFQFFDSQNARGLALSPHDLLKAYHLRELDDAPDAIKEQVVNDWEQKETKALKNLFAQYLYPIRRWSAAKPGMAFSKDDIAVFKGINISRHNYPFMQALKLVNHSVNAYNQNPQGALNQQAISYPFQLTQTMINGQRFFEWLTHYQTLLAPLLCGPQPPQAVNANWLTQALSNQALSAQTANNGSRPTAYVIMQVLHNQHPEAKYQYSHHWRTGDVYVRRLFNALLLCYYDRFGPHDLPRALEYIFIWAYSLRLKNARVSLQSIETYISKNNLFTRLLRSVSPTEFLNKPLPQVVEIKASNTRGINHLFADLGYCTQQVVQQQEQANA